MKGGHYQALLILTLHVGGKDDCGRGKAEVLPRLGENTLAVDRLHGL